MEADPEQTRALVAAVTDDMFAVADQMLETANSGMADLVASGKASTRTASTPR